MEIKNVNIIHIDDNDKPAHLKPTLKIKFEIWDLKPSAIIFQAYGDLCIDDTIVSKIFRYTVYPKDKPAGQDYKNKGQYFLMQGYAELDKESLDFIEKSRDADEYNDINFSTSVTISYLQKYNANWINGYQQMILKLPPESIIIKSSDWVNKFAPRFGIGNFLVLEIPFYNDSSNKVINEALKLIGEAEKDYRAWNSKAVLFKCRDAVELLESTISKDSGAWKKFHRIVEEGDKGLFGFLSLGGHKLPRKKGSDNEAKPLEIKDLNPEIKQYDAEAALYFTKILVKYAAELLKEDMAE